MEEGIDSISARLMQTSDNFDRLNRCLSSTCKKEMSLSLVTFTQYCTVILFLYRYQNTVFSSGIRTEAPIDQIDYKDDALVTLVQLCPKVLSIASRLASSTLYNYESCLLERKWNSGQINRHSVRRNVSCHQIKRRPSASCFQVLSDRHCHSRKLAGNSLCFKTQCSVLYKNERDSGKYFQNKSWHLG